MPSSCDKSPEVTQEDMACTVLKRFVDVPEQTYEDFLTTFTHLPQERRDCPIQTDDSQNHCSAFENTPARRRSEDVADRGEVEELEQLVISEGETVGCCHSLMRSGRVQVDNFLSSSDLDANSDDEDTRPHLLLYPGEAETKLALEVAPVIRSTSLDIQTSFRQQPTPDEHLDDEIQPFALDRSFDYDCVALTPKISAAELDFLKDRGHQKTEVKDTEEQNLTAS
ncbi:PREDICTED: uncharacterized protein C11orf74 homolog [Nanorana parkeri]|uniref:uncharacterized protein C11orf74 homolog n=1 Tax=Nanorana parkeri TaxID=125878 RepID=UPI000854B6F4|nr:PREDICTED: uncharacterized protein C11orf74 homolog [Nanorana parkeri]